MSELKEFLQELHVLSMIKILIWVIFKPLVKQIVMLTTWQKIEMAEFVFFFMNL